VYLITRRQPRKPGDGICAAPARGGSKYEAIQLSMYQISEMRSTASTALNITEASTNRRRAHSLCTPRELNYLGLDGGLEVEATGD